MMVLIAVAITVAYVYSSVALLGIVVGEGFFWELATLIDIMLLGHWVEMQTPLLAGCCSRSILLSVLTPTDMHMGRYASGDVLLAVVRIGGGGERKVRPVVVISPGESGSLFICPVSSSPSTDGISIPLSLDDFARGGLDLFTESYALAVHADTIRTADVVAKKGTLLPETLAAIQEGLGHPRERGHRRRR